MDDDDLNYYKERLATLDAFEKIQIEKRVIERLMARRSDRSNSPEIQINPPVGECKKHTDWCIKLVSENRGKLNREQIIRYLKGRIKSNSKDPDQAVGDALGRVVKDKKLRVESDGTDWMFDEKTSTHRS